MNVFLIGYSGVGKTYFGKMWSKKCGIDFYDLDDVIEKNEGRSIKEIFSQEGEGYFRKLETEALKMFTGKQNYLVACGGGTACFNNNIQWINDNGTSVYLRSSPENVLKRLINEKEERPLIKDVSNDELLFFITKKIKEREVFYNRAKIIVSVDGLTENYIPEFLKPDNNYN